MFLTKKQETAFWKKVRIGKPNECWEWTGACSNAGRGGHWRTPIFYRHKDLQGNLVRSPMSACRAIYMHTIDHNLTDEMMIVHTCGNNMCANPMHLDIISKHESRGREGLYNPGNLKLTDADVLKIRELYDGGMPVFEIHKLYSNVKYEQIWRISKRVERKKI